MELALQQEKAKHLRADILKMLCCAKSGHPGGSLSCVEILMALYYNVMKVDPSNPHWEQRDRFVLSKGHACPALYAVLADKGFFPREELWTLRKTASHLQGHPDMRKTAGVDVNTGSLGQGVSIAGGLAMAAKYKGENHRVFALVGDGEIQEGIVWEAAMSAAHYKLDNLVCLVDNNGRQLDGAVADVMSHGKGIGAKFDAFGWNVIDVADGNDVEQILGALEQAKACKGKPTCLILNTVKGKGATFAEPSGAHSSQPTKEQWDEAIAASEAALAAVKNEK